MCGDEPDKAARRKVINRINPTCVGMNRRGGIGESGTEY